MPNGNTESYKGRAKSKSIHRFGCNSFSIKGLQFLCRWTIHVLDNTARSIFFDVAWKIFAGGKENLLQG
jgi:hypothetical protein